MAGPIVMLGTYPIAEGKGDQARAASKDMATFVAENHPRVLHFQINISEDGSEMTVLQVHPDEASLMQHMQIAGDKIKAAFQFLTGTTLIQVFGDPSPEFRARVEQMSGGGPLRIHSPEMSFSRLS